MGYLTEFTNDFFVSYRRAANDAHDRWVEAFCDALAAMLKELVGEVSIWRDQPALRGGEPWRPEIERALNDAAIFLAIVSRTYLDSDECRRELDAFLGRLKDRSARDECQRRIVPVFKQPLKPEQELPPEIRGLHRHDFFRWDPPGSNRFRELGPDRSDEDKLAFWEALARVAQDLMITLEDLNGRARQTAICKVFIARVSPELELNRERLRVDLNQRRYLVVPEREYLWNADNHREHIERDMAEAQLCIHLVAKTSSIDANAAARAKLQLTLAHQTMKRLGRRPPLVWIQPANAVADSARDLIQYIETELADDGVEYWQGGLEEFKTQVIGMLPQPAGATTKDPGPSASDRLHEVALLFDEDDLDQLPPVTSLLVDRFGVEPKRIKFTGSMPKEPSRLKNALAQAGRGMIVWARQPEEWVSDLLNDDQIATIGKGRLCIYAIAPKTPEKESFKTVKAKTILAGSDATEADLRAFLLGESDRV